MLPAAACFDSSRFCREPTLQLMMFLGAILVASLLADIAVQCLLTLGGGIAPGC